MSLSISLTTEQVEQRLSQLGIPARFTDEERLGLNTTAVVSQDRAVYSFPIPTDNSSLTLSKIKDIVGANPLLQPAFFDHPWYADEEFMEKPCPSGWHSIFMDVCPESVGESIDYVRRLQSDGLELPMAVEVVLMLFLHYAGTKEQLLLRKHTWCSDLASLGRQVTVGAFGRNGVFVSAHPPGFSSRGLGMCPKVQAKLQVG